jgi:hypothetical protein
MKEKERKINGEQKWARENFGPCENKMKKKVGRTYGK